MAERGGDTGREEDGDSDKENQKARRKQKPAKPKAATKVPETDGEREPVVKNSDADKSDGSSWDYSAVRTKFIENLKADGKTYQQAKTAWDSSLVKAQYLAPVSVGELKKRRFLPSGALKNPWYERIHANR